MPFDRYNRSKRNAPRPGIYRSKLEEDIGADLIKLGYETSYEKDKFRYVLPPRSYTPDFRVGDFFIEVKGWFPSKDRTKLLAVMKSNPELPLFIALQSPHQRLSKKSKTTVAMWCQKHGIPWCPTPIPADFLEQWATGKRPTFHVQTKRDVEAQMELLSPKTTDQFTVLHVANTSPRQKKT